MPTTSDVTGSAMQVKQRHEYREDNNPAIKTSKILSWAVVPSFTNVHSWLFMHDRVNQGEVGSTVYKFKMADAGNHTDASAFHQPKLKSF